MNPDNPDLALLEAILDQPDPSAAAVLDLLSAWEVGWQLQRRRNLDGVYGRVSCYLGNDNERYGADGETIDEAVIAAARKLMRYPPRTPADEPRMAGPARTAGHA